MRFSEPGDLEHRDEIAGHGEEAFALGGGIRHGAQVQIGDVAHIDRAEIEPGQPGMAPSIMRCTSRIEVE